jgi:hypothetical protein
VLNFAEGAHDLFRSIFRFFEHLRLS